MLSIYKVEVTPKGWGEERVIINNLTEGYCAKILVLKEGKSGSFHFHGNKTETWYVVKGRALLSSVDPETGHKFSHVIIPGDVIHITKLTPHKLQATEDTEIFETSTYHDDSDTYRIAPGDSQR
jgi:mannose-6-phosphate isomerase-like protein (cupin superfamily)